MNNTQQTFVLAPFSIGGHPVSYSCARNSFRHNISCAILVRHFLRLQEINIDDGSFTAAMAQAVFQTGLNEMIGSMANMPPEVYLDALAAYMLEVTGEDRPFQDPWMPAFLNEEILLMSKPANKPVEKDIDLVSASQILIRDDQHATATKPRKRNRKPTRKERIQQRWMKSMSF